MTGRFIIVECEVLDREDLGDGAKLLWGILRSFCRRGRRECWPGEKVLAERLSCDLRTIKRGVHELVDSGLVRTERKRRQPMHYFLSELTARGDTNVPSKTEARGDRSVPSKPVQEGTSLSLLGDLRGDRNAVRGDKFCKPHKTVEIDLEVLHPPTPLEGGKRRQKPTPDPRVKVFLDWFVTEFKTTMGRDYVVIAGKDGMLIKRLLHVLDGKVPDALGELQRATANMLSDGWGREHASVGLLGGQINGWRANGGGGNGRFHPAPKMPAADYEALTRRF